MNRQSNWLAGDVIWSVGWFVLLWKIIGLGFFLAVVVWVPFFFIFYGGRALFMVGRRKRNDVYVRYEKDDD